MGSPSPDPAIPAVHWPDPVIPHAWSSSPAAMATSVQCVHARRMVTALIERAHVCTTQLSWAQSHPARATCPAWPPSPQGMSRQKNQSIIDGGETHDQYVQEWNERKTRKDGQRKVLDSDDYEDHLRWYDDGIKHLFGAQQKHFEGSDVLSSIPQTRDGEKKPRETVKKFVNKCRKLVCLLGCASSADAYAPADPMHSLASSSHVTSSSRVVGEDEEEYDEEDGEDEDDDKEQVEEEHE
ncbi:hypothetical protein ZWY2020_025760 [Hordeum vulgare]|nr:hypothetical protein ZWY2020_025760 [Hordeum vulgare]